MRISEIVCSYALSVYGLVVEKATWERTQEKPFWKKAH